MAESNTQLQPYKASEMSPEEARQLDLVKRAQNGDREAFSHLYESYCDRIYTYLRAMIGSTDEAQDMAQETFLKAWMHLHALSEPSKFRVWLYRIAHNIVLDFFRQRRSRSIALPMDHDPESVQFASMSSPGPEEQVEKTLIVWLALEQLPSKQRDCLLLRVQGFSPQESADLLGAKPSSVRAYIASGRKQLRKVMENDEMRSGRAPAFKERGTKTERVLSSAALPARGNPDERQSVGQGMPLLEECAERSAVQSTKKPDNQGRQEDESSRMAHMQRKQKRESIEGSGVTSPLPEPYQSAVHMHCQEGRSYSAIAAHFQLSIGTIKSRISRGRKKQQVTGKGEHGSNGILSLAISAELAASIDALPEPYRTAVRLHYVEQCSFSVIATRLDQPEGTVKSWISRGKKMLHPAQNGRGGATAL